MKYNLRPEYQVPCVNGVRDAYRLKKKAPLLVAPTGSGKTVMFSYMAESASQKGKRVLIMAHLKELLTQCGEKMIGNEVDFGYINPNFTPDYRKLVQVGTIQSIVKRMDRMYYYVPPVKSGSDSLFSYDVPTQALLPIDDRRLWVPDLIIIDEAHLALAPTYLKIIQYYRDANPDMLILGVTATPVRGDGKGLNLLFDDLIMGPTVRVLIDLGYLVEPETYGSEIFLDTSNVDIGDDGEFNQAQLAREVNARGGSIIGDAVAHYTKICPGAPAIAFCVDIQHAISVAADFRVAGYLFEHIDGTMTDAERTGILTRLRKGALHGITSVNLVIEGFDAPMATCAILLRPVLSVSRAIQMPGRVLRPYTDPVTGIKKLKAIILDHANVSATLAQGDDFRGFIDDDRFWTLEGESIRKKKKKGGNNGNIDKFSQCPICFRQHKPSLKCPSCGHVYKAQARAIDVIEGELVKLTRVRPELKPDEITELQQMAIDKGLPDDWAETIKVEWENRAVL